MTNPLNKRVFRELQGGLGKYFVVFILIAGMIAIYSGYSVANKGIAEAYESNDSIYKVEDGNFELFFEASDELIEGIEAVEGAENELFENFYYQGATDEIDSELRVFANREGINEACVHEGSLPSENNEIAIDRMYAKNNGLSFGDTITVDDIEFEITGLISLPDYAALYENSSDMMFDATKFGVSVVTAEGFDHFSSDNLHYSYSWSYLENPDSTKQENDMAEDILAYLSENTQIQNFIPAYSNQAIIFPGEDITRDNLYMNVFITLILIVIAFVFAISISNTISQEANSIGTLRASGYTKGEMVRHYLAMPMIVTVVASAIGNALGYSGIKEFFADMYYQSYSLPTFMAKFNLEAFVFATVTPLVLMLVINTCVLCYKLSLSPLKLIRRDLSRKQRKKAVKLNSKIGIMSRFRMRTIMQNIPNYIMVAIGVFFASVILLFGMSMNPVLKNYNEESINNMICNYQYVLKAPFETEDTEAEKYSASNLRILDNSEKGEAVTIYGISQDSSFVELEKDVVYISSGYADKYDVAIGDVIELTNEYTGENYSFTVGGEYNLSTLVSVFMSQERFCEAFDVEDDYFTGYFSNEEVTDIPQEYIASYITVDDYTKTGRQLIDSFDSFTGIMTVFGMIVFVLLVYLLSKMIIQKNAQSISMTKILGYSNLEISKIYIASTTIVVIVSLIVSILISTTVVREIFGITLKEYPGYFSYDVPLIILVEIFLIGLLSYVIVAVIQMIKISRIPKSKALNTME